MDCHCRHALESLLAEVAAEGVRCTVLAYGCGAEPPPDLNGTEFIEEWVCLGAGSRNGAAAQSSSTVGPGVSSTSCTAWTSHCKSAAQCEALRKALLGARRHAIAIIVSNGCLAPVGIVHLLRWAQLFLSLPARLLHLPPCLATADKAVSKSALRLASRQVLGLLQHVPHVHQSTRKDLLDDSSK